jgi:hypothetical protein
MALAAKIPGKASSVQPAVRKFTLLGGWGMRIRGKTRPQVQAADRRAQEFGFGCPSVSHILLTNSL